MIAAGIHGVAIVPVEGDPRGYLANTELSGTLSVGRVPRVSRDYLRWHGPVEERYSDYWRFDEYDENGEDPPYGALLIWWNGKLVPEGFDRAVRCRWGHRSQMRTMIHDPYDIDNAIWWARTLTGEARGLEEVAPRSLGVERALVFQSDDRGCLNEVRGW